MCCESFAIFHDVFFPLPTTPLLVLRASERKLENSLSGRAHRGKILASIARGLFAAPNCNCETMKQQNFNAKKRAFFPLFYFWCCLNIYGCENGAKNIYKNFIVFPIFLSFSGKIRARWCFKCFSNCSLARPIWIHFRRFPSNIDNGRRTHKQFVPAICRAFSILFAQLKFQNISEFPPAKRLDVELNIFRIQVN